MFLTLPQVIADIFWAHLSANNINKKDFILKNRGLTGWLCFLPLISMIFPTFLRFWIDALKFTESHHCERIKWRELSIDRINSAPVQLGSVWNGVRADSKVRDELEGHSRHFYGPAWDTPRIDDLFLCLWVAEIFINKEITEFDVLSFECDCPSE